MKEIQYLGHILSTKGIRPLPSRMQAIKNMHPPKTPKQVCACLGLVGCYRKFIRNFAKIPKSLDTINLSASKIWVDTSLSQFFFNAQGVSQSKHQYYTTPIQRNALHSLYRCIRWHLWSTAISRTWWNRTTNSIPFTHFHWHSMEMVYHRTRSLQCILCSHEKWLLPSGNWNNSTQWPQTTSKIS